METITIKDIARMCGVGVSTVSRAMNDHPDINEETKQKVMEIIKEYNYIPNNSARNLKLSESRSIAILVKGISNPFFLKMIKVMEDEIQKKRYALVLHHVEMNEDEVDVALELIKEKRLQGIVFLGGYFSHTKEKLAQLQVPFVLSTIAISQKYPDEDYSSVSVDDVAESYKIVDYLCKLGHKRIATIVASAADESVGSLRQEGYRKALKDNKVLVDESLIYTMKYELDPYTMENGYAVMNEILARKEIPTAIYAISDTLAIGACKAILESGRRIPEDISVAGYDGIDMAYFYSPSITTIRQPIEEIAKETVTILFDVIKGKTGHQHKTFEGELVIGESTREIEETLP